MIFANKTEINKMNTFSISWSLHNKAYLGKLKSIVIKTCVVVIVAGALIVAPVTLPVCIVAAVASRNKAYLGIPFLILESKHIFRFIIES